MTTADNSETVEPVDALAAARKLAASWPLEAQVNTTTGLPVCVETARHVVEAFKRLGCQEARPLAAAFYAWNREATLALATEQEPPKGALRVEVGSDLARKEAKGSRGWRGHLIVDHPRFLLDLVLPGVLFSVKATGFDGAEPLCVEKEAEAVDVGGGAWMVMTHDPFTFRYEPQPRMASWRNTAAWRSGVDEELVEQIIERMGCGNG